MLATAAAWALSVALGGHGGWAPPLISLSQELGDIAALVVAAIAAGRSTGFLRAGWIAVAAAFSAWAAADGADLLRKLGGSGYQEAVDVLDIGWIAFSLLIPVAIACFYMRFTPETGWHGTLNALTLAVAVGALTWTVGNDVLHLGAHLDALNASGSLVYCGGALTALVACGWLVARLRGGPPWLRWVLVALAVEFAGEALYVAELRFSTDPPEHVFPWVLFALSAWLWAFAGHRFLADPHAESARPQALVPAWTEALPAVMTLVAVGSIALPAGWLGLGVFVACALAVAQLVLTNRTNLRLLGEQRVESLTDPLTGTRNRRLLDHELSLLIADSRHAGAPLSLLAIDLDGFKRVNDTHGHSEGDRLLVTVVRVLQTHLRDGDLLFRLGGDEFVAILPGTEVVDAQAVAERLRLAIAVATHDSHERVTASIGVVQGPGKRDTPATLLAEADRALYRAKHAGRNRVVVSSRRAVSGSGPLLAGGDA